MLATRGAITSPQIEEKATAVRPVAECLVDKHESYVIAEQLELVKDI